MKKQIIIFGIICAIVLSVLYIKDFIMFKNPANALLYSIQRCVSANRLEGIASVVIENDDSSFYIKADFTIFNKKAEADIELYLYEYGTPLTTGKLYVDAEHIVVRFPALYEKDLYISRQASEGNADVNELKSFLESYSVKQGTKSVYLDNQAVMMNSIKTTVDQNNIDDFVNIISSFANISAEGFKEYIINYTAEINCQLDDLYMMRGINALFQNEQSAFAIDLNLTPSKLKEEVLFEFDSSNAIDLSNITGEQVIEISNSILQNILTE